VFAEDNDDLSDEEDEEFIVQFVTIFQDSSALLDSVDQYIEQGKKKRDGVRLNMQTIPQDCKSVTQVYRELGPGYFRCSFRMIFPTFQRLFDLLPPYLIELVGEDDKGHSPTVKLACQFVLHVAFVFLLAQKHMTFAL